MTEPRETDKRLEHGLRELAAWEGERPTPALWGKAIESAASGAPARRRKLHRRPWRIAGQVAAVAAVLVLAVAVFMPALGRARSGGAWRSIGYQQDSLGLTDQRIAGQPPSEAGRFGYSARDGDKVGRLQEEFRRGFTSWTSKTAVSNSMMGGEAAPSAQPAEAVAAVDRHVVRKASVEFKTADVRAAFLKASLIPNAAMGEYVEDSAVTGEGAAVSANLTLRVTAERLPEALNQVRELGTVTSEQVRGDDVTAQVVDIESRLRNERRIEQELLELVEKRQDAALKDLLELRSKLSEVRAEIERMEGHRATLGRLVSLATVLVLIRPADGPPGLQKSSLVRYLGNSFDAAWRNGVEFLIDSSAAIVRVFLGGLIWWTIVIGAIVFIRRHLRRAALLRGEV